MAEDKIINCHTHIFTGDNVPPYLAKTYVPVVYKLLNVQWLVDLFRWWYRGPGKKEFTAAGKKKARRAYESRMVIRRSWLLNGLVFITGFLLFIYVFYFAWSLLGNTRSGEGIAGMINRLRKWVENGREFLPFPNLWVNIIITFLFLLLFRSGRNLLVFALKKTTRFFALLPGPQTAELLKRYLNIGRFAFHKEQTSVFTTLCLQYPPGTRFIVLPMDMDYMDAGKAKTGYMKQMEDLARLKTKGERREQLLPFIFVDPRRISEDPAFFDYEVVNGMVELKDCFIKEYLAMGFCGFKIYPALGYYPFDERLLPLWKFAEQQGLPVMTHCIRGTIFYRGAKKKEWDNHSVFEQLMGKEPAQPLLLPQVKNVDFSVNFTHPLNYLCILEKGFLQKIVARSADTKLHQVFGYDSHTGQMSRDLSGFKICFGHFGGADEWQRYLNLDRDKFSPAIINNPGHGIDFLNDSKGQPAPGKIEQVWKSVDWYTIICSLMLQYKNVYADLSYILHDIEGVFPLLKLTLRNPLLKTRVLYGTDFYVVRNHKSDKSLRAGAMQALTEDEFDQIARINPLSYIATLTFPLPVPVQPAEESGA